MGYRSDVGIAISQKDFATFEKNTPELMHYAEVKNTKDVSIITYKWIKWEEYIHPEIEWINNFLKNTNAIFIRIGEDITDCEECRYGDTSILENYLFLKRTLGTKEKNE